MSHRGRFSYHRHTAYSDVSRYHPFPPPLREQVPLLLSQHIPTTIDCFTLTRMHLVVFDPVAVVIREFFSCRDIPEGENPDTPFRDLDLTVGITGMIDI